MNIRKRNNIRVFGHRLQPMIFAHGFGSGQNMWRFNWPDFEDKLENSDTQTPKSPVKGIILHKRMVTTAGPA